MNSISLCTVQKRRKIKTTKSLRNAFGLCAALSSNAKFMHEKKLRLADRMAANLLRDVVMC